jgi:hypothetical protein
VADAEGWARDRVGHSQSASGAAHERGLASAKLTAHEHDLAGAEIGGQLAAK